MQRNFKRNEENEIRVKSKNRYWPVVFCCGENKYIAISKKQALFINGRFEKVNCKQWAKENSIWISEKHFIDFSKFKIGDVVKCVNCSSVVDFRLFISTTMPGFGEKNDKIFDSNQLSNS